MFKKHFNSLCKPAQIYLAISCISILILFMQNVGDPHKYRIGSYQTRAITHNVSYFIVQIIYVAAWTWILNKLCSGGYSGVSWFLILLPFIGFFIMIGLLVLLGISS